jgi:hypothetical protein
MMATARKLSFPGLTQADLDGATDSYDNLGDISTPRPFRAEIIKVQDHQGDSGPGWRISFKVEGVPPLTKFYAFTPKAVWALQRLFDAVGVRLLVDQDVDPTVLVGEVVTLVVGQGNEMQKYPGQYFTEIKNTLPYVERPIAPVVQAEPDPPVDEDEPEAL